MKNKFKIIYDGVIKNLELEAKGEVVDWRNVAGNCAEIAKKEILKLYDLKENVFLEAGLTMVDAAKTLGVSRRQIYNLIDAKKIKTFDFKGRKKIKIEEIQNYLKTR